MGAPLAGLPTLSKWRSREPRDASAPRPAAGRVDKSLSDSYIHLNYWRFAAALRPRISASRENLSSHLGLSAENCCFARSFTAGPEYSCKAQDRSMSFPDSNQVGPEASRERLCLQAHSVAGRVCTVHMRINSAPDQAVRTGVTILPARRVRPQRQCHGVTVPRWRP
jgi:hypothetical protein